MKKMIFVVFLISIFLNSSIAMATWTLTPSKVYKFGHYIKWKVVCTSDGNALSITDLFAVAAMPASLLRDIKGSTLMAMKVSPGTLGVIPNTTINIILSDDEGDALWTDTAISKDAISWHEMYKDINIFIPPMNKLYLTLNDIGDSGDQVTLYFFAWIE